MQPKLNVEALPQDCLAMVTPHIDWARSQIERGLPIPHKVCFGERAKGTIHTEINIMCQAAIHAPSSLRQWAAESDAEWNAVGVAIGSAERHTDLVFVIHGSAALHPMEGMSRPRPGQTAIFMVVSEEGLWIANAPIHAVRDSTTLHTCDIPRFKWVSDGTTSMSSDRPQTQH